MHQDVHQMQIILVYRQILRNSFFTAWALRGPNNEISSVFLVTYIGVFRWRLIVLHTVFITIQVSKKGLQVMRCTVCTTATVHSSSQRGTRPCKGLWLRDAGSFEHSRWWDIQKELIHEKSKDKCRAIYRRTWLQRELVLSLLKCFQIPVVPPWT